MSLNSNVTVPVGWATIRPPTIARGHDSAKPPPLCRDRDTTGVAGANDDAKAVS
jgi:hypothetical protein